MQSDYKPQQPNIYSVIKIELIKRNRYNKNAIDYGETIIAGNVFSLPAIQFDASVAIVFSQIKQRQHYADYFEITMLLHGLYWYIQGFEHLKPVCVISTEPLSKNDHYSSHRDEIREYRAAMRQWRADKAALPKREKPKKNTPKMTAEQKRIAAKARALKPRRRF